MTETSLRESFLSTAIQVDGHTLDVPELPLKTPFNLPFGKIDTRPSAWLGVSGVIDGTPAYGAAEGTSLPMQIPLYDDFSGNLKANVNTIMAELTGKELTVAEARSVIQDVELGGNFATARMTVETSLIDMTARSQDRSVYEALTGEVPEHPLSIPYGKSIAENEFGTLVSAGIAAVRNGATRLKFKLSPANHDAVAKGIWHLQQLYPNASFMVDANGMFNPDNSEHLQILERIDGLGLMMIEEPVSRAKDSAYRGLDAHRRLKEVSPLRTPVALDDSIISRETAHTALEEGLGQIVNLKPGRVGSFIECLEIADFAQEQGREIMVGGMLEATPGRYMTTTLAALCLRQGFTIPGDISLPQERITRDLLPEWQQLHLDEQGNIAFQPSAGWGYRL